MRLSESEEIEQLRDRNDALVKELCALRHTHQVLWRKFAHAIDVADRAVKLAKALNQNLKDQ